MDTKASKQRKILTSALPPKDKEFLWLHLTGGKSILKDFVNGKWVAVGDLVAPSHTEDLEPYAPDTPPGSVNYVTTSTLTNTLLMYVTNSSLNSALSIFLKKLTAGTGIKLTGNTISVDVDTAFSATSTKPLANWVINNALVAKQNKLTSANAGDNVTITTENGVLKISASGTGTPPDLTSLINRVTALENAGYVPRHWFKTLNDAYLFDTETEDDAPNGGNLSVSGSGGSGIHIAQPNESTDDINTLYFFTHNPLQGVGLYNTLLLNGSLTGTDGTTYTYHPGKFYHLYDDGSFVELPKTNDRFADCDPDGNAIYYNFRDKFGRKQRVLTTMEKYGSIIIPHKIQYAETSDTVYYSLQVKGPFFAEYTDVKLIFDGSELQALLVTNATGSNPYTEIEPNGIIRFTYNDYYVTRYLLFKRKGNIESAKDIHVVFNNGHKDVDVTLKYGAVRLFYKDGVKYSGFNLSGLSSTTYVEQSRSFRLKLSGTAKFAYNIQIHQSKLNLLYAKVNAKPLDAYSGDTNNGLILVAFRDRWEYGDSPKNNYFKTRDGGGNNNCAANYDRWGSSAITCLMREARVYFNDSPDSDLITLSSLAFYQKVFDDWWSISEVGLIEHENPFTE